MKRFLTNLIFSLSISFGYSQEYPLETVIQKGHSNVIKSVAFSRDGKYLVSASRDKTVKLWEVSTGREIRTFIEHTETVTTAQFDSSGTQIITGGADNLVKIWEVATGKELATLKGHQDLITFACFSPDDKFIFSGGYDWKARIWNAKTKKKTIDFDVNPDKGGAKGISAKFLADGKTIIIGGDNSTASLIDISTGKEIMKFKGNDNTCGGCFTYINISNDQKTLLTANNKGYVKTWDISTGKLLKTFMKIEGNYNSVNYSFDNKRVIATTETEIKIIDALSGNILNTIDIKQEIKTATVSPIDNTIAVAYNDLSIKLWNLTTGKLITIFAGFLKISTDEVNLNSNMDYYKKKYLDLKTEIKLSPDNKYFIKGNIDSIAKIIELSSGKLVTELKGHSKTITTADFSPDGKYVATASLDFTVKLWDTSNWHEINSFGGFYNMILAVHFSSDSKWLIASCWDGSIVIWDVATGKEIKNIRFNETSAFSCKFLPNGMYFAGGCTDTQFKMWEVETGFPVQTFIGHTDMVSCIDFTTDSKLMVSGAWDGKVKLWDLQSGLQVRKFAGHNGAVNAVALDKSGKILITGGNDCVIKIWDIASGNLMQTLTGYTNAVTSLSITNDGKTLISCNIEGIVKVWDLNMAKEIYTFIQLNRKNWMVCTPDGFFDATEGAKQSIFFVKGMETYALDQFFEDFYRPSLLQKAFNNRQIENKDLNLNDKLKNSPPPTVEIITPLDAETFYTNEITLKLQLTDNGGGINELKILHNGKRIPVDFSGKELKKGKFVVVSYKLTLVQDENQIVVSAFSKGRIESNSVKATYTFAGKESNINCYVFVIGINKYENKKLTLQYARDDAEGFVKVLTKNDKKLYKNIELTELYDKEANQKNILAKLDEVAAKAQPQDVFIFYYAGHGIMINDDFYFIPSDCVRVYDVELLFKEAIYAGNIQDKFKNIKALKQLVILDACHSGGSTEILGQRGAAEEKAIAQLSRSAGVHVLASAGSEQYATEFKSLSHGIFTYLLIEALDGKADGAPSDGKVTIYELKSYLDDQVPEFSKKLKGTAQYPYTFSKGNDFPVTFK